MEKIHARQLILKIFTLWPKKNSYEEFDNEKKSPPYNFSNGPSLNGTVCVLFKPCLAAHRVLFPPPPRLNGPNETQITINNCGAKMKPVHLTTE